MSEDTNPQPVPSEETYTPNPYAARILSQAIQFGYAPSPLPDLSPEWFHYV